MSSQQIQELWYEYYPKVYGYFFRRLESVEDVEDLTCVTLEQFLDTMSDSAKVIRSPHAYLWKIAYYQLVDFVRQKNKTPLPLALDDQFEGTDDELEKCLSHHVHEQRQRLWECVERHMDLSERVIVEQVIMLDRKAVEVAPELGLKPENVRQKIHRALKKLRLNCKQLWHSYGS
jgi:RNA polymerase sigma factor (sigma-70 family)